MDSDKRASGFFIVVFFIIVLVSIGDIITDCSGKAQEMILPERKLEKIEGSEQRKKRRMFRHDR